MSPFHLSPRNIVALFIPFGPPSPLRLPFSHLPPLIAHLSPNIPPLRSLRSPTSRSTFLSSRPSRLTSTLLFPVQSPHRLIYPIRNPSIHRSSIKQSTHYAYHEPNASGSSFLHQSNLILVPCAGTIAALCFSFKRFFASQDGWSGFKARLSSLELLRFSEK
jgi:hypothetical protein